MHLVSYLTKIEYQNLYFDFINEKFKYNFICDKYIQLYLIIIYEY